LHEVWTRLCAGAAIFAALAAGAAISPFGAPRIEARLRETAADALNSSNLAFASIDADGRRLSLSGKAPGPTQLDEAVRLVAAIPGVSRVDASGLAVAAPAAPAPEEATVEPEPAPAPSPVAQAPSAADCQAALNRPLNGRRLTYRNESARLSKSDRALLDQIAEAIASCAGVTIAIEGHTDSTGSEAANLRLSERRAKNVEAYLAQFDLPAVLIVRAYGESRPIASNQSPAGRSANRRIDFVVDAARQDPSPESD